MKLHNKIWARFVAIGALFILTIGLLPTAVAASMLESSNSLGLLSENISGISESVEQASGEYIRGLGFVFGLNDNGDMVSMSPAVMGSYGEESYIWANAGEFTDDSVTSFVVYTSTREMKALEFTGASQTNYVAQFKLAAGESMDESFLPIAPAYEGSAVTLQYVVADEEGNAYTDEITGLTVDGYDDSGEFPHYFLTELPSNYNGFFPAQVVDTEGSLVAIIDPTGYIWAVKLDAENFAAGSPAPPSTSEPTEVDAPAATAEPAGAEPAAASGDKEMAVLILDIIRLAVILIIIIVVIKLILGRKNKKKEVQSETVGLGAPPKQGEFVMEELSATMPMQQFDNVGVTEPVMPETSMVEEVGATVPIAARLKKEIIAVDGPLKGQAFAVEEGSILTIGRGTTEEVVFPAATQGVSRSHCCLYFAGGKLMLEDVGSTYGTYIAGVGKINAREGVEMHENETFYLGQEENAFEIR